MLTASILDRCFPLPLPSKNNASVLVTARDCRPLRAFASENGCGAVTFDGGMNIADSAAFAIPVRLMVLDEDYEEAAKLLIEAGIE